MIDWILRLAAWSDRDPLWVNLFRFAIIGGGWVLVVCVCALMAFTFVQGLA